MNNVKIAAALRLLAEAFETPAEAPPAQPAAAPDVPPQKRGRGRPVKGEDAPAPAPAPAPAAPEVDPFEAAPATPTTPTVTREQVANALRELSAVTTQANAVAVLEKASGVTNLPALSVDKYAMVLAATKVALRIAAEQKPEPEADPFSETPGGPGPAPAKALTLEDVKAEIMAAQKRTSVDTVQKIVMAHGGKAKNPDTGTEAPSLKALPESQFAATVAALKALPSTK